MRIMKGLFAMWASANITFFGNAEAANSKLKTSCSTGNCNEGVPEMIKGIKVLLGNSETRNAFLDAMTPEELRNWQLHKEGLDLANRHTGTVDGLEFFADLEKIHDQHKNPSNRAWTREEKEKLVREVIKGAEEQERLKPSSGPGRRN